MTYRTDDDAVKKAQESVKDAEDEIKIANIEKQIDLLNDQKDLIDDQIDALEKQKEAIEEYYETLIKETEAYYDAMIAAMEEQKSKYQELQEMLEEAQMKALLKELGVNEEALLAGSEEEFNKLRDGYLGLLKDLNAGNQGVLDALSELSGIDMNIFDGYLEQTKEAFDGMGEYLEKFGTESKEVMAEAGKEISTGLAEGIEENASVVKEVTDKSLVGEKGSGLGARGTLTQALSIASPSKEFHEYGTDIDQGLADGITENSSVVVEAINGLVTQIEEAVVASGLGPEGTLFSSIGEQFNNVFNNTDFTVFLANLAEVCNAFALVQEAIESVSAAISGGGSSSEEGANAEGGEGSGGGSSLVDAISTLESEASEKLPLVAGQFAPVGGGEDGESEESGASIYDAAQAARAAIAGDGGETPGSDEKATNVKDAVYQLTEATLDEERGLPAQKTVWEELGSIIEGIVSNLGMMKSLIEEMGDLEFFGGSGGGSGLLSSLGFKFSKGTNGPLKHDEPNSLVGENYKPEIVTDGDSYAVVSKPTMLDLKAGQSVIGEKETAEILRKKGRLGSGKAFASGTLSVNGRPFNATPISADRLADINRTASLIKAANLSGNLIVSKIENVFDGFLKELKADTISTQKSQNITNTINVTLPNVTNETSARNMIDDLRRELAMKKIQAF